MTTIQKRHSSELKDLRATCDQLAELDEQVKALRARRDTQFESVTKAELYTVPAILNAMGISRSRHTQMLRAMRDRNRPASA